MAKRTAIIDIGSNSARLVIFEKTSRYGFHLICEQKSKVRIGEGAYEKKGYLQTIGIKRAFLTLKSFLYTIDKYQANKTICIATSALRDAPNARDFMNWIQKELGLSIKIISGEQEARYGAIAANNLLPFNDGISIDIGGGSSDMTLVKNGQITASYSLNLGTVRLKELFSDKALSTEDMHSQAKTYIQKELDKLPKNFKSDFVCGIGGTARTLSKTIMKRSAYPLDKLHAFSYSLETQLDYLQDITSASEKELKRLGVKKNRYDTIREGTLIFLEILSHLGAKEVISSSVGVREGVFLEQTLRDDKYKFPPHINPSIHSILDRFKPLIQIERKRKTKLKLASSLYKVLQKDINDAQHYKQELLYALQLSNIGKTLTIYKAHQHAFYIAMQELNYRFTHKQILLISLLLRMHGKELLNEALCQKYKILLPPRQEMLWLSFIYTLSVFLHEASNAANIDFSYEKQILVITSDKPLYLAKEKIQNLEKPLDFHIIIKDEEKLPKNKSLGL
ncbi:MAG: Ppx/GppA family phosphatase [Epsilonproteobacteria bacterium]|nr:MAG: Ppx/GppA family phosphatase [Campylobacterota bacterium]